MPASLTIKDSLEGKLEYAFLGVLSDAGLEEFAMLVCGHEFEEKEGPQIAIAAMGGLELVYNSGNWRIRTRISIRSAADKPADETEADDPREVHRALVQRVRDALYVSNLEALLTAHENDFTCNQVVPLDADQAVEGRYLVTTLELECDCVRVDF